MAEVEKEDLQFYCSAVLHEHSHILYEKTESVLLFTGVQLYSEHPDEKQVSSRLLFIKGEKQSNWQAYLWPQDSLQSLIQSLCG